jgi:hypothetical protein
MIHVHKWKKLERVQDDFGEYAGYECQKCQHRKIAFPKPYYTDNIVSLFRQWETGRVQDIRIEFQEGSRYALMWNGGLPTASERPPKGRPLTLVK